MNVTQSASTYGGCRVKTRDVTAGGMKVSSPGASRAPRNFPGNSAVLSRKSLADADHLSASRLLPRRCSTLLVVGRSDGRDEAVRLAERRLQLRLDRLHGVVNAAALCLQLRDSPLHRLQCRL